MHRYLIVIERAGDNYSAYAPDLPGCVATGADRDTCEAAMVEALKMHIDGLVEDGLPIPAPTSTAEVVALAA